MALGLVGGTAVLALALLAPLVVLISVFPATYAYWRVGPASVGMSVADALTFVGVLAALPFVPWRSPTLRRIMVATAGYCAILMLTVIAHPSQRSLVEVFHRASMVVGAMLIGAAVARLGRTRLALRAFLLGSAVISVAAFVDTLAHKLQPAYPFGIQKNSAGELLVMGLIILLTVPDGWALSRWQTGVLSATLLVGLAASEARGPALALVAVFALHLLRQRRAGGSSRIAAAGAAAAAGQRGAAGHQRGHLHRARPEQLDPAVQQPQQPHRHVLLRHRPRVGAPPDRRQRPEVVLRTRLAGRRPAQPGHRRAVRGGPDRSGRADHAAVGRAARPCAARPAELGETAYLVLVARILESMLGIFWTAGTGTLPFLIVGLVVGEEQDLDADRPVRVAALAG